LNLFAQRFQFPFVSAERDYARIVFTEKTCRGASDAATRARDKTNFSLHNFRRVLNLSSSLTQNQIRQSSRVFHNFYELETNKKDSQPLTVF
jgi:hypothetical protein